MKRGAPCRMDLAAMYQVIVQEPGLHKRTWLWRCGITNRAPDAVLQAFEAAGMLLYEDDHGRLYPMERPVRRAGRGGAVENKNAF